MSTIQGDYADFLRNERGTASNIFHELRLAYRLDDRKQLFVLLEGEADRLFYLPYLRTRFRGLAPEFKVCNGVGNVQAIWRRVESDGFIDRRRVCAFVDRDYSDLLGVPRSNAFFTTRGYSLESILLDKRVVDIILEDGLGIGHKKIREEIIRKYREAMTIAGRLLRGLCAIYLTLRKSGADVDFDEHPLRSQIVIDRGLSLKKMESLSDMYRGLVAKGGDRISCGAVRISSRSLKQAELRLWMRGKLVLELARRFYRAVVRYMRESYDIGVKLIDFGEVPLFAFLGGRVPVPPGLPGYCARVKMGLRDQA